MLHRKSKYFYLFDEIRRKMPIFELKLLNTGVYEKDSFYYRVVKGEVF